MKQVKVFEGTQIERIESDMNNFALSHDVVSMKLTFGNMEDGSIWYLGVIVYSDGDSYDK